MTRPLRFSRLRRIVWCIDATRAPSRQETDRTLDKSDPQHIGHVAALRMHQYRHRRYEHETFPSLSFCILSLVLVSISSGLPNHDASIQLCVQKLRILIEDSDQNCTISTRADTSNGTDLLLVKYLGLLAMSKILQTHPKSVQAHNDLIMQCLDDKDESIRLRALDLLSGMVRRNAPHRAHSLQTRSRRCRERI